MPLYMALKWLVGALVYMAALPLHFLLSPLVALFTAPLGRYREWAINTFSLFLTYDNPPEGDRGWVGKRSPFPNILYGWRGYVNRLGWVYRNPLYGLKKKLSLEYGENTRVEVFGNEDVNDKYGVPGWLFCLVRDGDRLVGWEWYSVTPY